MQLWFKYRLQKQKCILIDSFQVIFLQTSFKLVLLSKNAAEENTVLITSEKPKIYFNRFIFDKNINPKFHLNNEIAL